MPNMVVPAEWAAGKALATVRDCGQSDGGGSTLVESGVLLGYRGMLLGQRTGSVNALGVPYSGSTPGAEHRFHGGPTGV